MQILTENKELIGLMFMPITYGFIGWVTNVAALKMTFYPLKFWGIPPYLGWQGIVPRKATGLALKAVQMLTERLVKIDDFFSKIKPEDLNAQYIPILENTIPPFQERILKSMGEATSSQLGPEAKKEILQKAISDSKEKTIEITGHLEGNVGKIFNLKTLVLRALTGPNVSLIVDIFQSVGSKEFKFIERSGWYFGAILGSVQVVIWSFFPIWWTLPLQGVVVGYVTNWLALYMIFSPKYPKKILGVTVHGLFLKRQVDVSKKYSEMFAKHILTPKNIMEEILYRRIARTVVDTIQEDLVLSLKKAGVPEEEVEASLKLAESSRSILTDELIEKFSESSQMIEKLIGRGMNVETTMFQRMKDLPPDEFEPILRSAFQEDEYVLILIGSLLGALVGLLQAVFMV